MSRQLIHAADLKIKTNTISIDGSLSINGTAFSPSVTTTLTSTGIGNSLISDGTGPTLQTKGIVGGVDISVTDNGSYLTINNTGAGTTPSLNNMGSGESLLYGGGPSVGPTMYIKSISAGSGMTVTDISGSQLELSCTTSGVTSYGSGTSLCYSSNEIKTLNVSNSSMNANLSIGDDGNGNITLYLS